MENFSIKHRLEPMSCLSLEGEFKARNRTEARMQCCQIGMIPDGPLADDEKKCLEELYEDTYMRALLLKSFESFNSK